VLHRKISQLIWEDANLAIKCNSCPTISKENKQIKKKHPGIYSKNKHFKIYKNPSV